MADTKHTASQELRIDAAMMLEFVDRNGDLYDLDCRFEYDAADPFAVDALISTGVQQVRWTFGRDLLVDGLYEPAGHGDVQVWPCLSTEGSAVVIIELSSPDGEIVLRAPSRPLHTFVQRMLALVPRGAESVDVDSWLLEVLPR